MGMFLMGVLTEFAVVMIIGILLHRKFTVKEMTKMFEQSKDIYDPGWRSREES